MAESVLLKAVNISKAYAGVQALRDASFELKAGEVREVTMHDGSVIVLKNLENSHDPTNRFEALRVLEEGRRKNWLATGLIYISTDKPSLSETYNLVETPLNRLQEADLRPGQDMIDKVNALTF